MQSLWRKGSRVVVQSPLWVETLDCLHDGHQGLTATLQRVFRMGYWPHLQDDVSAMTHCCCECQIHANKKHHTAEWQTSASHPMGNLGIDLMKFKGWSVLVSVDYSSGCITVDYLQDYTSATVIPFLNHNFQKFGLAAGIISDNGPWFKSEKLTKLCDTLEMKHTTSSPHYHQGNDRAERAIQTAKQIMEKTKTDVEATMAVLAWYDTPCSGDLPSPVELFFNRRINTHIGLMYQSTGLNDERKTRLYEKRPAHLTLPKGLERWVCPGPANLVHRRWLFGMETWLHSVTRSSIQLKSYWIVNTKSNQQLRQNKRDIKPRFPVAVAGQTPSATNQSSVHPPESSIQQWELQLQPDPGDS